MEEQYGREGKEAIQSVIAKHNIRILKYWLKAAILNDTVTKYEKWTTFIASWVDDKTKHFLNV